MNPLSIASRWKLISFSPQRLNDVTGRLVSKNEMFPAPNVAQGLSLATLRVTSVSQDCSISCQEQEPFKIDCQRSCANKVPIYPKIFNVSLTTDQVALFVWLEALGKDVLKTWNSHLGDFFLDQKISTILH